MTGNDPSDLPELPIDSRAFRDDTKSVRRRRGDGLRSTGTPACVKLKFWKCGESATQGEGTQPGVAVLLNAAAIDTIPVTP